MGSWCWSSGGVSGMGKQVVGYGAVRVPDRDAAFGIKGTGNKLAVKVWII